MEQKYAGFWVRAFASLIDSIIVTGIMFIACYGIVFIGSASGLTVGVETDALIVLIYIVAMFLLALIYALYMILLTASRHQGTFGKRMMGIYVGDENGNRITIGRSTLRFLGTVVNNSIGYVGYIMVGIHPKKQGLHDLIAKTYVYKR